MSNIEIYLVKVLVHAHSDQLAIGILAKLVNKCRSPGSNPVQA